VSRDDVITDEAAAAESAVRSDCDVISDVIIAVRDWQLWHEASAQRPSISYDTATERRRQAQSR